MKNRKTRSGLRRMLLTLALVLVVAVASVGGTIAWLTVETEPVVNTFTVGDINIELYETRNPDGTQNEDGSHVTNWSAKLIPGSKYAKDPVVTVTEGSEACWLFVKFEEINNPSTYLTYTSALTDDKGWTKLIGEGITETNVWYREVAANATTRNWYLLEGETAVEDGSNAAYVYGCVTVKETLTKNNMPTAENKPQLKYTAYAIQKDNISTAAEAWQKISSVNAVGGDSTIIDTDQIGSEEVDGEEAM